MRRLSPVEIERRKIEKAMRTLVRLKHSLAADEELNEVLPDKLDEFDNAVASGALLSLKAGLADALGDV